MSSDSEKPAAEAKPESKPAPAKPAPKPEEKPVELPAFEKGISDKIVAKFADKVEVDFVKDRVGIKTSKENVRGVAQFNVMLRAKLQNLFQA